MLAAGSAWRAEPGQSDGYESADPGSLARIQDLVAGRLENSGAASS